MMNSVKRYTETALSTQRRGKLVVALYDGCIRYLKNAREKLEAGDPAGKGEYIVKAQAIIAELNNSLKMEAAPELTDNLRALYNYMHRRLSEANMERDVGRIDECLDIMETLADAWRRGVAKAAQQAPGQDPRGADQEV